MDQYVLVLSGQVHPIITEDPEFLYEIPMPVPTLRPIILSHAIPCSTCIRIGTLFVVFNRVAVDEGPGSTTRSWLSNTLLVRKIRARRYTALPARLPTQHTRSGMLAHVPLSLATLLILLDTTEAGGWSDVTQSYDPDGSCRGCTCEYCGYTSNCCGRYRQDYCDQHCSTSAGAQCRDPGTRHTDPSGHVHMVQHAYACTGMDHCWSQCNNAGCPLGQFANVNGVARCECWNWRYAGSASRADSRTTGFVMCSVGGGHRRLDVRL